MAAPRTTRYWLRLGTAVASLVLAALAGLAVAASSHASDATHTMADRDSPALTAAVSLGSALVNQETGVRGYGLSGTVDFLQPYQQGITDEQSAVAALRSAAAGGGEGQQRLEAVLALAQSWQTFYAQPIAAAAPAQARALSDERLDRAKTQFDALRTAMTAQQDQLQRTEEAARRDLADAEQLRDGVFIAVAGAIVIMILLVFEGLRRGVTRPLTQLSADARQVAAGDLTHPISPSGPADLRALAADVEAMRRRLAGELAAVEQSRRMLDEQATELERSNAELEQFAYVASHDLQEPLRKVASFCQLLQRRYAEQLDERANQYIEFAVDGANRMQTLIQDLLAFSRVGRTFDADGVVDLEAVFDRVLDTLSITIEETGAQVTHDRLPTVTGDQTQLGMLLQNLLSNAVKFRDPERPPRIAVTVTRAEAEADAGAGAGAGAGAYWEIAVTDNGIGIPAEYAERVFAIFQRLHSRDAYPGNGIGLAVSRKIVELHGGRILIDPDQKTGTRIVITFPVREAEPGEPGGPGEPGEPGEPDESAETP
ncbi:signal transduction histidine kinase [Catenulispora sp. MAP5-51]|uniref:sensor histidine kinase n=1 Tax=Catenulispora sp. MAP5-51 TaxID=3156298 RepID=UPI0035144B3E